MDLDGTIFWYVAGALVLSALVISYIGIKGKEDFPPTSGVMRAVIAAFVLLVVGVCAYGVANAAEEKEHRDAEIAEEEAAAEEALAEAPPGAPTKAPSQAEGGQPPGSAGESEEANIGTQELAITSPEDGSLAFDPDALAAEPGAITLAYANPSPVPHNVALEDEGGQQVVESDTIADDSVSVNAELVPGEYVFYCTVPGHREGGMEGTLTVERDSATSN